MSYETKRRKKMGPINKTLNWNNITHSYNIRKNNNSL